MIFIFCYNLDNGDILPIETVNTMFKAAKIAMKDLITY